MKSPFAKGISHGLPIALGYFFVSFGFGIMAVQSGIRVIEAIMISLTNLTSAGQTAGVSIIQASGDFFETLLELALTQFVINLRYSLMGISLSQKLSDKFTTPHRMIAAFGITDEIFAVASSQKEKLVPSYMYGMILIASIGWTGGTAFGAIAGLGLPDTITSAMGILLYGMFIAIILPAARTSRKDLIVICLAAIFSIVCKYAIPDLSNGFAIIICSLLASILGAILFPIELADKEEDTK